jgi:4-hydroxybenzoate polyprenyltransferase
MAKNCLYIIWEVMSKKIISVLLSFTIIPVYLLVDVYDVGTMEIYFYACLILLLFFLLYLWKSERKDSIYTP